MRAGRPFVRIDLEGDRVNRTLIDPLARHRVVKVLDEGVALPQQLLELGQDFL